MRIAMIGQKGMPAIYGGVERHVHELSTRLVRRGHEVTVYSRPWYSGKGDKLIDGVRIKSLPSLHTKNFDAISHTFLATIHALLDKFDVIHYHGVGPAILCWLPRLFKPGIKVVVTFHSIDRDQQKWSWFAKLCLRLGERLACVVPRETIVISRSLRQYVKNNYRKSAVYIPNGVPNYAKETNTELIGQWGLEPRQYILAVARLIPLKGIHTLIESFKQIKKDQPESLADKKLVIVGDGSKKDRYVQSIKKRISGDKNIALTGFQTGENLAQLYSHAYLMVHPSTSEGLPITVLEGMSYGLPILVSDIPGHKELIDNPDFLFNAGSAESLKEKMINLASKEKKYLIGEGNRNRAVAKSRYNWKNIVSQTVSIYQKK